VEVPLAIRGFGGTRVRTGCTLSAAGAIHRNAGATHLPLQVINCDIFDGLVLTSRPNQIAILTENPSKTLAFQVRLYFRQIVKNVIIAPARRIRRAGFQQSYPRVQWSDLPHPPVGRPRCCGAGITDRLGPR
jgi:hypothetical protein